MTAPDERQRQPRLSALLAHAETRVALVTALALLVQAAIAKNVIEVELDYWSQFAALWVFIVFLIGDRRDRRTELGFMAAIIAVTVAVLVLYAVW
jgi:hypothetical protein